MHTQASSELEHMERQERLRALGWNEHFERLASGLDLSREKIARVLSAQRDLFLVSDGSREWFCPPSGKLRHGRRQDYPVTGDWVLASDCMIEAVLERKNTLRRGGAGSRGGKGRAAPMEQPMGANIDTAFIVCGLDRDYNLRRIERYVALVYNCDISPVVVLTKADLHGFPEDFRQEVENVTFGIPVVLTSMMEGGETMGEACGGLAELHGYLGRGRTVAMIGSSGAGKSTLANLLHGSDLQHTAAVSASLGKGRHTTTARELLPMPQGGILMDNPGIREIAFSADEGGVGAAFPDIQFLAESCRFADCTHAHEPGCAVRRAVEQGELEASRLENYHKMSREMDYVVERSEKSADRLEKERWRDVSKEIKRLKKRK